ncbi:MAG: lysylphosphatidylglycerol synthase transmembrane domain-containing protein [Thermodesulfobacteriota bacterium]
MKKLASLALRLGLAGACLAYALWGVDFAALGHSLRSFALAGVLATLAVVAVDMACVGLRLRWISGGRASFAAAFNAGILGLGLNNVVPAKLGEVAKAAYLRRGAGVSLGQGMGMVFWERFADLHALIVMALFAAAFHGKHLAVVPLAGVVAGLWLCLAALRLWPGLAPRLVRLLYFERLKSFASDVLDHLAERRGARFFTVLALATALTWFFYCVQYYLMLWWGAGLDLSFGQVLSVFVFGALGLAVPSSPGGVGVYEAVMVAVLTGLGVDKEQALAVGLVYHATFYIPVTAYALGLLARKGLTLASIRAGEGAPEAGEGQ